MMAGSRSTGRRALTVAAAVVAAVGAAAGATAADAPSERSAWGSVTSRASVSSAGQQANGLSFGTAISAGGRYVAFRSNASNLVPGDTNGTVDVFVRDRLAGLTRRVSIGPGGRQASGDSFEPALSADGRYVAFSSDASNLVPGDTNGDGDAFGFDVFVRDRLAGVTRRVSVGPAGRQGKGSSWGPAISADGRYVAFYSGASNLVPGDTNRDLDVFVRDRQAKVTRRVSIGSNGQQANLGGSSPAISADGRYVAFYSGASNLVPGDTNRSHDVFVRDRVANLTRRASIGPGGRQTHNSSVNPVISADGRYVAFQSYANNLVPEDTNHGYDVFVRDRMANMTRRVSIGPGGQQANEHSDSGDPAISANGRYVAFYSAAPNLVAGDTNDQDDVFVRDRRANVTRRVSIGPAGRQANAGSGGPAISAKGQHVAFYSGASNLVPGDTNNTTDVFVRDRFGDARVADDGEGWGW